MPDQPEFGHIAKVLADHRVNYHHRNVGPEPVTADNLRYTSCDGCDWLGGHRDEEGWERHIATILAASSEEAARIEPHEHDAAGCLDCECLAGPPNSVSCTCPPDVTSDLSERREEPDGAPDHQWQVTTPEGVYDHG